MKFTREHIRLLSTTILGNFPGNNREFSFPPRPLEWSKERPEISFLDFRTVPPSLGLLGGFRGSFARENRNPFRFETIGRRVDPRPRERVNLRRFVPPFDSTHRFVRQTDEDSIIIIVQLVNRARVFCRASNALGRSSDRAEATAALFS